MFLSLYYKNYDEKCNGNYWEENSSLPYQVRIPDATERAEFCKKLEELGFKMVTGVSSSLVVYVNFTLKRYGGAVKAVRSNAINEAMLTKEQFENDILQRYCDDPIFRERLEDNYLESAAICLAKTVAELKHRDMNCGEEQVEYEMKRFRRYRSHVLLELVHCLFKINGEPVPEPQSEIEEDAEPDCEDEQQPEDEHSVAEKKWRFCAVGNIVEKHQDEEGHVYYGTKAFVGGSKVYISDWSADWEDETVTVMGLNRFHKYETIRMPMNLIENVRATRVFKPGV